MQYHKTMQNHSRESVQPSRLRSNQSTHFVLFEVEFYHFCKRLMDLIIVTLALLTIWPFLLCIAILIKLDSPGPIFFVQDRIGSRRKVKNGESIWVAHPFQMWKFRTMAHNADQSLHVEHIKAFVGGTLQDHDHLVGGNAQVKLVDDPRITRIGRILRETSLDELPQVLNVLRGEMSIVGPRPVPPYEVELYQAKHYERLMALPGITGLWQVEGRGNVSFEEMVRLDIQYVRGNLSCSIWH